MAFIKIPITSDPYYSVPVNLGSERVVFTFYTNERSNTVHFDVQDDDNNYIHKGVALTHKTYSRMLLNNGFLFVSPMQSGVPFESLKWDMISTFYSLYWISP